MNARSYRVNLSLSPVDFPPIMGLGESSVFYQSEPPYITNNKVVLKITNKYILLDMSDNQEHEVLKTESTYEIPCKEIKSREDVYEFFNDAILSLNEAYQYAQKELPALPKIIFPTLPIKNYQREIDGVLYILDSQN